MTQEQHEEEAPEEQGRQAGQAEEEPPAREDGEDESREERAFDENPPVEPAEPQVGNSNARFFMPREPEGDDAGEESDQADR